MKKNADLFGKIKIPTLKKIFKVMKLTAFLILISVVSVWANKTYSQNKTLTLNIEKTTLKEILSEIENQSDFIFMFSGNIIDINKEVSINAKNQKIEEILDALLEGADISYTIKDRIIVLSPEAEMKLSSQIIAISGKVTDYSGAPLPGVTVVVKGTTQGAITDAGGNYSLSNVNGDGTLIFSFVGMKSQEIPVAGKTTIDVVLAEDAIGIEEVVAVGYGTIKKQDITYAVAKVNNQQLETRKVPRLEQALQGQLAGVRVQQSSGVPGNAPIIRIRGIGSITSGNIPLYVIDGIPVEDLSVIANLDFNDVASVEVLKDAAAASIYGSRGSNGVILVTTKTGEIGKMNVNYNMYYGVQSPEKTIDFLNGPQWAEYSAERRNNAWVRLGGGRSASDPNSARTPAYQIDPLWLSDPESVPTYDHQDWLFNTAPIQNHQLTVTGGSQKIQYYFSADYLSQEGIVRNSGFERYSFRSKVTMDINKHIKIGVNISPSSSIQKDPVTEGKEANIHRILLASPVLDLESLRWNGTENPLPPYSLYGWQVGNSVDQVLELDDPTHRFQTIGNMFAEITFARNFKFRSSLGIIHGYYKRNRFWNKATGSGTISSEIWTGNGLNWLTENTLTYSNTIGKHNFTGLLGYTTQKDHAESLYVKGLGFPNELVQTINGATEINSWNEGKSEWSLLSYIGRLTYSFDSRYLVTASIRRDGSSRFGADNRWGYFPAASLGWRVSEENFFKSGNLPVNELKLRASWGLTGNNQIGNYSSIARLGAQNYPFGTEEKVNAGLSPSSKSNPDLGWEKTAALNTGIDAGIFDSRIFMSVDYYINKTSDLLFSMPIPTVTGFSSILQNIGDVENRGYELELTTRNLTGKFQWKTLFNYSHNQNEVKKLRDNDASIISGSGTAQVSITQVGQPIASFYMHVVEGVWNNQEEIDSNPSMNGDRPGGIRLKNISGDDVINADDRTIVGSPIPTYTFGITNEFSYKNIDLSVLVYGAGGNKIYNDIGRQLDNGAATVALYAHWDNRWRSESDPGDGITPNADLATPANSTSSTRWLYDGDFFRIQNVTLGYTLPKQLTKKLHLSNLRIYCTGENLFLKDKYPVGYNPEVSSGGESVTNSAGYDYGAYPLAKKITFGLSVGI
jgi:TonB-linked SusC/RagA family outer membrane protein